MKDARRADLSGEAADDKAAISAVLGGDRDAFRVIVERYKGVIFGVIMRQVGERNIAEEIAQEVFLKAFSRLGQFRGGARLSTWLTRIALNETSNYFSSKRFRERAKSVSFDPAKHDVASEPREQVHGRLAAFQLALGELPETFRSVLVLCGLEGKSYEEAALVLDVPVGTVRSRLNRARLMIRDKMREMEGVR